MFWYSGHYCVSIFEEVSHYFDVNRLVISATYQKMKTAFYLFHILPQFIHLKTLYLPIQTNIEFLDSFPMANNIRDVLGNDFFRIIHSNWRAHYFSAQFCSLTLHVWMQDRFEHCALLQLSFVWLIRGAIGVYTRYKP